MATNAGSNFDYDVLVIGAGTAGLTASRLLAKAGQRVGLVERDRPGGDCLWTGCVPTKALIHAAKIYHEARNSSDLGIDGSSVTLDFGKVREHVLQAQQAAGRPESPEAIAGHGVTLLRGGARFVDPYTIAIDGSEVRARHFVIATGSAPTAPTIPGLAEAGYETNVEAVDWDTLPESLCVIGGGPIGLEFAQVMARFGCEVTVVEAAERILGRETDDAADVVRRRLAAEGVRLFEGASIDRVEATGTGRVLHLRTAEGEATTVTCERLLVATGRRPRIEGLRLDQAGLDANDGNISVDGQLRTSQRHIFAVGDVAGGYQFTHVAEAQGRLIANILQGKRFQSWSDRVVPRVTYTDPEVAAVGMTAREARRQGMKGVRTWRVELGDVDRAITMGATDGFIAIVTVKGWNRWIPGLRKLMGDEIVGATMVSPNAGELLMPVVMAMRARLPAGIVAWNMQAYPTLSLGVRQAAGQPFDP